MDSRRLESRGSPHASPSRLRALGSLCSLHSRAGGISRAGLLSRLFGLGREKKPRDPLALLSGYEKEFPQGVLASAAEPRRQTIERQLKWKSEREQAEARAAALLNSEAPDFTLQDLEDHAVSLSDCRGKTILLSFWGYG